MKTAVIHPGFGYDPFSPTPEVPVFMTFGRLLRVHRIDPQKVRVVNAGNKRAVIPTGQDVEHFYPPPLIRNPLR